MSSSIQDMATRITRSNRLDLSRSLCYLGREPWTSVQSKSYLESNKPGISVIITLYNYSQFIVECLNSVFNSIDVSIFGGIEVIVVDDFSTDGSSDVVKKVVMETTFSILLIQKHLNTGLADTRNIGISLARSNFVFILDADNWIYPNCLATLYKEIIDSNYTAVYGIINAFDSETKKGCGLLSYYEWDVACLIESPYIDAMALISKDALVQVNGYSIDMPWNGWEDYDLWLKFAQLGLKCKLIPQILSSYRRHPYSMINTTSEHIPDLVNYLKKKFYALIPSNYSCPTLFGYQLNGTINHADKLVDDVIAKETRLETLTSEVLLLKQRITAMETSKFWKIRRAWFKFKQFFSIKNIE